MLLRKWFYKMRVILGLCVIFIIVGCRYLISIDSNISSKVSIRRNLEILHESQNYVDTVLNMTRIKIKFETWDYNFTYSGVTRLEDLVMESGGTPVRSVIVSTWRSGSSFLGDLLNAMPGNFYHYEPLIYFKDNQIRTPPYTNHSLRVLKKLLMCDYNGLRNYFEFGSITMNYRLFSLNSRLWEICVYKKELCVNPNVSSSICKLYPFQNMKVVRLRLRLFEKMINDKKLKIKVVLLIRDPRGVMQSRKRVTFCSSEDCNNPKLLCTDMISDYLAAKELLQKYPKRLMVLRFEDLALNLNETTSQLLKFLRLQPNALIDEFLSTHTIIDTGNAFSTSRSSHDVPFKWKTLLDFNYVTKLQDVCKEAMKLWGYKLVDSASDMKNKNFYPLHLYSMNLTEGNRT